MKTYGSLSARMALVCCVALGLAAGSQAATFTSFDLPWGNINNGGPVVMNASGVIAGTYDAPLPCPCVHAFVRAANGTLTSFDAPNAFYTEVESINSGGAIAGFFKPSFSNFNRSFIRSADGSTFIVFDPAQGQFIDSHAFGINTAGAVTGDFLDFSEAIPRHAHSFVRAADGSITVFDVANAAGTYARSINDSGIIAGFYEDASQVFHGFVRAADGTITTFDAKNNTQSTFAAGLDSSGAATGGYSDAAYNQHGFLRTPDGKFDRFDVSHADWTVPTSMSPSGIIAGWYQDATGDHGFVREAGKNGKITTFDVPFGNAATPTSILDDGTVAGWYWDMTANAPKGFFGKP